MKRCWIYTRVANSYHKEVDLQRERLMHYAQEHHLQIVGVTVETADGRTCNRNGLKKVIQAIQNNLADMVLISDISRIGRKVFEAIDWVRLVENCGAEVISFTSGKIDTEQDRISWQVLTDMDKCAKESLITR